MPRGNDQRKTKTISNGAAAVSGSSVASPKEFRAAFMPQSEALIIFFLLKSEVFRLKAGIVF